MPLDLVIWIACAAFVWILVDWWLRSVDAKRAERHFDPDDWRAGLGVQWPDQQQPGKTVVMVRAVKRKKSA